MDAERTSHMKYLDVVARRDILHLQLKESTYQGSWKKRGGVGAFMMLARKWDRIETMLENSRTDKYDVLTHIAHNTTGNDGTILAEIRDLRRYLMLVEAEAYAQGWLSPTQDDVKEDSNRHAFQEEHISEEPLPTKQRMVIADIDPRIGVRRTDRNRP